MSRYSVKKPLTVFVAVVVIIALGIVSLVKMTPDLIPSIDFPYVMVMTTYPGATPEEVEETVSKPLEQSLATVENLKNIQSISNANYSMVVLEFENGASMDTAVVDALQKVDMVSGNWDDSIGSPSIMKINPSMMPIAVAAIDQKGKDTEELSTFVEDTLMNQLEGTTGVASISSYGVLESKINVKINKNKIEKLNKKLLNEASPSMADAKAQLNTGMKQLKKAEAQVAAGRKKLDQTKNDTYDQLSEASAQLDVAVAKASAASTQILKAQIAQLSQGGGSGSNAGSSAGAGNAAGSGNESGNTAGGSGTNTGGNAGNGAASGSTSADSGAGTGLTLADLQSQLKDVEHQLSLAQTDSTQAEAQVTQLQKAYQQAERGTYTARDSLDAAYSKLDKTESQLKSQKAQLNDAMAQLNNAGNQALSEAGLDSMITIDMVSGILQGQNFSMPAGYIQQDEAKYLVSVGDKLTDLEEVEDLYLFNISGLGDVKLSDVADVFMADNSDSVYGSVNGNPGVLLSFFKQSNYATATVSENIQDKFDQLSEKYEGLTFTTLMDQGDYIHLIISSILQSLAWGALFAILILLLFLRDIKPTFITLLSIPISITFAIVLMYFTGITINMISLSGLAVAVGMLVDNSIVVIENIFRLRRAGVSSKKAAVAGAKQVAGAITASTLTTVCVFAPIIFVEGITRQLFTDMALTVAYSLMASLIIALTLVPAMSSLMLEKEPRPEGRGFESFKRAYRRVLNWNLNHKALVLILALALFGYSVFASVSKGFIFIPDMATPQLSGTMTMNDEEATVDETKAMADKVMKTIGKQEGVETVGGMLASNGMVSSDTSDTQVSLYIIVDQESDLSGGEIADNIENACKDYDCSVEILSSSSMTSYTSALGGSGVVVKVYSTDNKQLQDAAKKLGKALEKVAGIDTVDNGLTEADPEIHFTIDKTKAMKHGLTVAQIFAQVSKALTYDTTSTSMNLGGDEYDIVVSSGDESSVTLKDLKNLELEGTASDGSTKTIKPRRCLLFQDQIRELIFRSAVS